MRAQLKQTDYEIDSAGNVTQKVETLKPSGVIKVGTGSKGEVKAKVNVAENSQEELDKIAKKVAATWKTLTEAWGE